MPRNFSNLSKDINVKPFSIKKQKAFQKCGWVEELMGGRVDEWESGRVGEWES